MFGSSGGGFLPALAAPATRQPPSEAFPPQVLRSLADKNYEKRKAGSQEVEALVRAALQRKTELELQLHAQVCELRRNAAPLPDLAPCDPGSGRDSAGAGTGPEQLEAFEGVQAARERQAKERETEAFWRKQIDAEEMKVVQMISVLNREFLLHVSPNSRKGGLVAIASVAIALETHVGRFLPLMLPPLLRAFSDPEARVRYYACEALYNVLKVAQTSALTFLNDIFDGVCKLYGDVDLDVRGGILFVDRLLKEIFVSAVNWPGKEDFLLLLVKRCRVKSPFIKMLVLSWISLLDSSPNTDLLQHLQLFLESLFAMLGDSHRDIRHAADACIASLLEDLKANGPKTDVTVLAAVARVVLRCLRSRDSFSRLTALVWLHALLSLALHASSAQRNPAATARTREKHDEAEETKGGQGAEDRQRRQGTESPSCMEIAYSREGEAPDASQSSKEEERDRRGEERDDNRDAVAGERGESEDAEVRQRQIWQAALQRELEVRRRQPASQG
ncbi:HEAT repeat-containing protein [Besnoitia besnoiti]|uniref:HEAT repeat-containing protein n=1 Tax=Besnoitia besnoiti TaxID=94643 RepID=A0A2A9M6N8_BESBE|nr:HEAT repeat-containing protein [Besnoitia besnoiti]PFH32854.1 HEAT repeat-containing protein [Besnoitia besnoiti]